MIHIVVVVFSANLCDFKKELRMNEVYYMLNKALC